jgi:hypothetical protein
MQPNVQWSKAWEGGYISGHDESGSSSKSKRFAGQFNV